MCQYISPSFWWLGSQKEIGDCRLTSLCNVIYKLVVKVLANRLKSILPEVISPNQSAFVLGRLIIDNILIASEALYSMNTRIKGKTCFITSKLGMSKAYERVEWPFLVKVVMNRMGFVPKWMSLIMASVTMVSYSMEHLNQVSGHPVALVREIPYYQTFS